jgi:hypothetical protein
VIGLLLVIIYRSLATALPSVPSIKSQFGREILAQEIESGFEVVGRFDVAYKFNIQRNGDDYKITTSNILSSVKANKDFPFECYPNISDPHRGGTATIMLHLLRSGFLLLFFR